MRDCVAYLYSYDCLSSRSHSNQRFSDTKVHNLNRKMLMVMANHVPTDVKEFASRSSATLSEDLSLQGLLVWHSLACCSGLAVPDNCPVTCVAIFYAWAVSARFDTGDIWQKCVGARLGKTIRLSSEVWLPQVLSIKVFVLTVTQRSMTYLLACNKARSEHACGPDRPATTLACLFPNLVCKCWLLLLGYCVRCVTR